MSDDPYFTVPSGGSPGNPDDADTLASLMDGTVTLDELPDEALGRLLRTMEPDDLLRAVGTSPKLFSGDRAHGAMESRRQASHATRGGRRPALALAFASLALAAGAGIVVYLASRPAPTRTAVDATPVRPSSDPAVPAQQARPAPVLLTASASDVLARPAAEFRGTSADGREPRPEGSVVAVEDDRVTIDLGALDGLSRGARVEVLHNLTPAGTITIDRVFRERASGTAPDGAMLPHPGDRVRVALSIQVDALLSGARDRLAVGERAGARAFAERAVERAGTASGTTASRVRALALLGAIDGESGNSDAAEANLRAALQEIDRGATVPINEAAEIANELGVVLIGKSKVDAAARILSGVNERASGVTAVRVANNLAAALALGGDRTAAEQHYREALARAAAIPALDRERRAIQQNLDGSSQAK